MGTPWFAVVAGAADDVKDGLFDAPGVGPAPLFVSGSLPQLDLAVQRSASEHLGTIGAAALRPNFPISVYSRRLGSAVQYAWLEAHGCSYAQGYHLGAPMRVEDLVELLVDRTRRRARGASTRHA